MQSPNDELHALIRKLVAEGRLPATRGSDGRLRIHMDDFRAMVANDPTLEFEVASVAFGDGWEEA